MFSWQLFQNGFLKEEYLDQKIINNYIYKINDNLYYDNKIKQIVRKNNDSLIIIDLKKKFLNIRLFQDQFEGSIKLYKSQIKITNNKIIITYQIDKYEPINSIIISRRSYEK